MISARFLPSSAFCRALLLGGACLASPAALAQAPATNSNQIDGRISSLIDSLHQTRNPTTAAISPDGQYVAWTLVSRGGAELHLTGLAPDGSAQDGAWDRILSPDTIGDTTNSKPGLCVAGWPAWSPDGKQVAFLSNCDRKSDSAPWTATQQYQVFTWTPASNSVRQLTHLTGEVGTLSWSPDSKSIAFLFVENATRSAGATSAMKPWSGVIGEDGIEVQRVGLVDPSTANFAQITPASLHVFEFGWSPDSKQLTFTAAPPPGENNWWVAQLYTELLPKIGDKIEGRFAPKSILDTTKVAGPLHGLQIAVPRFAPDGSKIAFIGGLMSDQGSTGGDIYVVPATGGEVAEITPNLDGTIAYLAWLGPNRIGAIEERRGRILAPDFDVENHSLIPGSAIDLGEVSISGGGVKDEISSSSKGTFALIRQSFSEPPEVFAGRLDNLKQITHVNDALKPAWGKAESIEWTNEGFHVQGWLLYPAHYDPSKKYPLVVSVHGGPASEVTPRWPGAAYGGVPFSALGYFVFMPNPRGSYGQGEKFTQANRRDFGYGDLRDILTGMDVLEQRFPIDKAREGITGWSYGGFMTMFSITQTTRFRAAVAGAGISDWKSYYGENSIDQWMLPFFGASVYDDPAVYAKSSAIDFVKNVKTPTLIVVGDRDGECPAPQSFELWHALRAEGVKTQLVVYPGEGHHMSKPEHNVDILERALRWFETEMPQ